MTFEEASRIERLGDGQYRVEIPDGWQQGRTSFGGLALGALLRAMQASEPEAERLPRSLNGELVGQLSTGPATIAVEQLRRGSRLSASSAKLIQNDEVVARASAVLARARDIPPAGIVAQLDVTPSTWEEILVAPMGAPLAPAFTRHYDFRPIEGFPYSSHRGELMTGWIMESEPPAAYDYASLVGLLDAYWPFAIARASSFRPGATVSSMAEFFVVPGELDTSVPLFFRSRGLAEYEGYSVELRELWSGQTLVAMNQQVFALIA